MPDNINEKIKEQYDHDNSGGSLNTNLGDFLDSESASGDSINTQWRNWASGTGTSLNTRLFHKHGGSGSFMTRWKNWIAFSSTHSFNFDGSNDYLLLPADDNFGVNDTWSVSFWFKSDSISTTQALFSASKSPTASNRIGINLHSSVVKFSMYGTFDSTLEYRAKSSTSLSSDTWYHLVATNSNGTLGLYINNVEQTGTSSYGLSHSARRVIGNAINFNLPFDGLIDEFAIWDIGLSSSDITSVYNNGKIIDLSKSASYGTDRTDNLKLWLRCGDKAEPESTTAIARQDFYTDFDGTNQYVDIDNTGLSLDDFSISGWFYHIDSGASYQGIISLVDTGNDYQEGVVIQFYDDYLDAEGASVYGHLPKVSANTVGSGILQNSWNHFAYTVDRDGGSGGVKLYVNGALATTDTAVDNATASNNIYIGAGYYSSQTQRYYKGYISNIAIHQTILDAQTISQMAKSRFTPMRDNRFSVVDFDGSNDYIATNANTGLSDATYTFWAKSTVEEKNLGVFGHGSTTTSGFHIWASDSAYFQLGDSFYRFFSFTDNLINDGVFHHFAIVADTSDISACKLYIDGVETTTSTTVTTGSATSRSGLEIGRSSSADEWEGSISQFAVYSDLKDDEFISAQYQKGILADYSNDTNLSAYYKMGDDTSKAYPTIADSSSNSNDGTITNGASDDIVQQMVAGYDLGAFESSSEELGGELVANGNFETNVSGWSDERESDSETTLETATIGGRNALKYQDANTSERAHLFYTNTAFTDGKLYKATFYAYKKQSGSTAKTFYFGVNETDLGNGSIGNLLEVSEWDTWEYFTTYYVAGTSGNAVAFLPTVRNNSQIGELYLDEVSVKEVLQSEVSDTYPAIIDVNEPVLGVELVDDIASWNTASGITATITTSTNTVALESDNNNTNSVTAYMGTAGILDTNIPAGLHKISFTANWTNPPNIKSFRWYYTGSSFRTYTITEGLNTIYEVMETSNGNTHFSIQFTNENQNLTLSNISAKQIQGNVGTMTNQDSSDLVYSSVLPDQSFLTGVNSAYNFIDLDGSNEYIVSNSNIGISGSNAFTMMCWFNLDVLNNYQTLMASGAGTGGTENTLFVYNTNKLAWNNQTADNDFQITSGTTFATGTWYHGAITYDGNTTIKLYVNGAVEGTKTDVNTSTSINITNSVLVIGRRNPSQNDLYLNGQITQCSVFNKELSSTAVNAIYNLGRHGNLLDSYSDNLIAYWAMSSLDSKTGLSDTISTIYDRSGNSNHATPQNAESTDLKSSPNAEPNGYAKGDTNRSTTTP